MSKNSKNIARTSVLVGKLQSTCNLHMEPAEEHWHSEGADAERVSAVSCDGEVRESEPDERV